MLTRGFYGTFLALHARYADFPTKIISQYTDLDILAESEQTGVYLFASKDKRLAFVTGHPEYDALTLAREYFRDSDADLNPTLPLNYFPGDNRERIPKATWRSHGHLLFSNWLNYTTSTRSHRSICGI